MKVRTAILLSYFLSLTIVSVILYFAYERMFLDEKKFTTAIVIAITSSALSLLINSFFIFSMVRVIIILTKQSQEIARGNYNHPLIKVHMSEIKELANSLKYMGIQIKDTIQELKDEKQRCHEVISNLSHDIKTPIASIRSHSEALLDNVVTNPTDVRNYLLIINKQTERIVLLTNELLDIVAIDQKNVPLRPSTVWIDQLILETLQCFESQLSRENRSIELSIANDCKTLHTDLKCIQRILYNIIENAIKFSDLGTTIKININKDDTNTIIDISDEGIGIPKEEINYIFERFYRVEKSRNKQYGGSGLGLAISKKLVEFIHGTLTVTSVETIGSKFTICIPHQLKDSVTKSSK